jgi:endonuclease/exonuclease/phosphatase family metal-dependent hydrolase
MSRRTASALCWGLAAIWAIWALIRLTGIERGYPLVPLMAYTPYMAVAVLLPLGVALVLRQWAPAALVVVAGLSLALVVLPRALSDAEATEPLGGPTVKVVSANVFRGKADLRHLVELVRERDADFLSVQELTPQGAQELRRLGIAETLPHEVLATRAGTYGGGIYSRLPLRRLRPAPGTTFRMPRASANVPGYGRLRLVGVHPYPPLGFGGVGKWHDGLESLPPAESDRPPWVLAGDFNATLDHSELRQLLDSGYRDAADVRGDGLTITWSVRRLFPPPVTIDHVLADERLSIVDFSVEDLPGSDHQALYAELSLPKATPGERAKGGAAAPPQGELASPPESTPEPAPPIPTPSGPGSEGTAPR